MPTVLAVCVVHALLPDAGTVGVTGIDKRPLAGPVRVGPYGLRGDVQADRRDHGGLEQAVYAYSRDDAAWWSEQLGIDLTPGWFGENLLLDGIDVNGARIGERWRIGSGDDAVEVEVTRPRRPCQTFARRVGSRVDPALERGWVKRFQQASRPGAYLRVVKNGVVASGDPVDVVARPEGAPTIAEVFQVGEARRKIRD